MHFFLYIKIAASFLANAALRDAGNFSSISLALMTAVLRMHDGGRTRIRDIMDWPRKNC